MSLITMQGFEESQSPGDYLQVVSGDVNISTSVARTGSQSCRNRSGTNVFICPDSKKHATMIFGFAINRSTDTTAFVTIGGDNATTQHIQLTFSVSGAITVSRGGTTLGTVSAGTIPASTWKHIGIAITLHDTTGSVTIYIDGSQVLNLTGIDTKNGGTATTLDFISFVGEIYIDDFYWLNGDATAPNSFLGDKKVLTLMPNGEGTTQDFTPSTGSTHYTLVDEKPRSTSDYVYSTTDAHIELFTFEDVPAGTQNISAVQIEVYANKSDASAVMQFERVVRSGGSNYFGNPMTLSVGSQYLIDSNAEKSIVVDNPNTSTAWTLTSLNAAEFGVRLQV